MIRTKMERGEVKEEENGTYEKRQKKIDGALQTNKEKMLKRVGPIKINIIKMP